MKTIKLKLDYLSYPIFGEYYSVEKHCTITKILDIDEDKVLYPLDIETAQKHIRRYKK